VGKLLEQFTAKTAKRAAEAANSAPVPASDKRIEVTGTIVSTRTQDHAVYSFGTVTKMLVRHETGYKVWGTMPSELCAKRGDVVSFTARIERSEKDETFGFFSRPTKARIVTKAPEAESTAA
jgi:hypothetical protein